MYEQSAHKNRVTCRSTFYSVIFDTIGLSQSEHDLLCEAEINLVEALLQITEQGHNAMCPCLEH